MDILGHKYCGVEVDEYYPFFKKNEIPRNCKQRTKGKDIH